MSNSETDSVISSRNVSENSSFQSSGWPMRQSHSINFSDIVEDDTIDGRTNIEITPEPTRPPVPKCTFEPTEFTGRSTMHISGNPSKSISVSALSQSMSVAEILTTSCAANIREMGASYSSYNKESLSCASSNRNFSIRQNMSIDENASFASDGFVPAEQVFLIKGFLYRCFINVFFSLSDAIETNGR